MQAGEKGCVSEEQKAKALVLCELALALVPSLDHTATLLLYKVSLPHSIHTAHLLSITKGSDFSGYWLLVVAELTRLPVRVLR